MTTANYEQLPHITTVDAMTHSQLIELHESLEVDVRSIRDELRDARERIDLGLSVDPEWERRARYGKSQRERLMIRARTRLRDLRRQELGGDPTAMDHRRWLHAIWTVIAQLEDTRLRDTILHAAKLVTPHPKGCTHCGLPASLGDVDGTQRVSEHVDSQAAKPSVVGNLADGDIVPSTLAG